MMGEGTTITDKQQPLISIVVPCYNELTNISPIYHELTDVMRSLGYDYEIIFVDDGSTDATHSLLDHIAAKDSHVHPIELVRNFGKEIAVTAGLHQAKGDCAITIDADLQFPPELIPDFIDKWRRHAEVVVGVRLPTKEHTSLLKRLTSGLFYRLLNRMSRVPITRDATDYRLLDRLVLDEFRRFTERNRLTRGLIDWLGFRHDYIYFHPKKRRSGQAAYTWHKLIDLAVTSLISMSMVPLKLAGYLGVLITLISVPLGIFILIERFLLNDPLHLHITGTTSLGVLILFLIGIVLMCLGLMSLYIASIYAEVTGRPLYVIRKERHF